MAHVLAIKLRSLPKKGKPSTDEPIILSKANEVFHIYELLENILSHLPALDLLVLQMVNPTCNRVVSTSPSFQAKLCMTLDPSSSGGVDKEKQEFGANWPKWNPFLTHYGTLIRQEPNFQYLKIKRMYLRRFDRPDASWKKMFLVQLTKQDFRALFEFRTEAGEEIRVEFSNEDVGKEMVTMELLMKIDSSTRFAARPRIQKYIFKYSGVGIVEHEGRDKRSIFTTTWRLDQREEGRRVLDALRQLEYLHIRAA